MGRPREHDERVRLALLATAEAVLAREGAAAVSVRRLADEVGTTTRAVYSLFGGKPGLLSALYQESFRSLLRELDEVPASDDPVADLVELGGGFRRYALARPNLYRLAFEQLVPDLKPTREDHAVAQAALDALVARVARCVEEGHFGGRRAEHVALAFHALCQGLASVELQGFFLKVSADRLWADSLRALLDGFEREPRRPKRQRAPRPRRRKR